MRIYHLSDWHATSDSFVQQLNFEIKHQKLQAPDLVILTGDMIRNFNPSLRDFSNEGIRQRFEYEKMIDHIDSVWPGVDIFGIRGNHDWCNYAISGSVLDFDKLEPTTWNYRGLNVTGFRGVGWFHGFWKDEYREDQLSALCELVPRDTHILITHCPPFGYMDDARNITCPCGEPAPCSHYQGGVIVPHNIGSPAIRDLVENRLPELKLHVFGHNHEQGGNVQVRKGVIYSNAACTLNAIEMDSPVFMIKNPPRKVSTWESD